MIRAFTRDNVLVLNGTDIGDPEVLAMLQAFYSRSPMPILQRLATLNGDEKELKEEKIKAALQKFYVGYGHASIGDCGVATVFIEGVSMLAAKVIQDDPLYNGQECSTRYLDFSTQPFLTANGTGAETSIAESWRQLYAEVLPLLKSWARQAFDPQVVLSSKIVGTEVINAAFGRTCDAIAFDVARSLLPCGAATSLAWTGTLRRLSDRCKEMAYHPLAEVRNIARQVYTALVTKHPSSFKDEELNPNDDEAGVQHFYSTPDEANVEDGPYIRSVWYPEHNEDSRTARARVEDYIREQSWEDTPCHVLRKSVDKMMYFNIRGRLDFGSFRDVQRHRNGMNRLPVVGGCGMTRQHSYYADIFEKIGQTVGSINEHVERYIGMAMTAGVSTVDRQYLLPMGTLVQVSQHWDLGQMRYVCGLRSKTSVHPTLREWVWELHRRLGAGNTRVIQSYCPVDTSPHYAASDRGEQTIKERSA